MKMSNRKTYKLGEVAEIKYGKDHKLLDDGDIPVYGSGGIMRYANKAIYEKESILIPRKGTLSNLFYLDKPFWSVDTMFYTKLNDNASGKFLYYLLKGLDLASMNVGSAVPSLTTEVLNKVEIRLPDLKTQHSIASILSSLDNKIELNLQMNQTLEAMAQAIFKEWFESDKKVELSEYIDINPKLSVKKESIIKYVEMSDLPQKGSSISSFIERPFTSGSKFQNQDTLMARITPCLENGKTGLVDFLEEDEIAYGSTEFIVMRAKSFISPYYVYLLARENNFRGFAIKSMVGTSGRQRVQTDVLTSYELSKVDESKMKEFHLIASSLFEKIKVNSNQNRALEESRDQLMPRLMSGKIEVKA
jgi:type I restriction enzyme, S subunit